MATKRPRQKIDSRHQEMDDLCKHAMETDGGRILELIFLPEICRDLGLPLAVPRLLEILPTELRRKRLHADYLMLVDIAGTVVTLHLEFQNRPDGDIGHRVLQYQAAVVGKHRQPVYSVVFNVHGESQPPGRPVRIDGLRVGSLQTCWITITVPAAAAAWQADVSSPMALLLSALIGQPSEDEQLRCLTRLRALGLDEETCRELVEALCFLLDIHRGGDNAQHEEARKRFFMKLRMEETWLYREGVEKGREAGREEGIEKGREKQLQEIQLALIERWRERFGPDELGEQRIRRLRDTKKLLALMVRIATASTPAEALAAFPAE